MMVEMIREHTEENILRNSVIDSVVSFFMKQKASNRFSYTKIVSYNKRVEGEVVTISLVSSIKLQHLSKFFEDFALSCELNVYKIDSISVMTYFYG